MATTPVSASYTIACETIKDKTSRCGITVSNALSMTIPYCPWSECLQELFYSINADKAGSSDLAYSSHPKINTTAEAPSYSGVWPAFPSRQLYSSCFQEKYGLTNQSPVLRTFSGSFKGPLLFRSRCRCLLQTSTASWTVRARPFTSLPHVWSRPTTSQP